MKRILFVAALIIMFGSSVLIASAHGQDRNDNGHSSNNHGSTSQHDHGGSFGSNSGGSNNGSGAGSGGSVTPLPPTQPPAPVTPPLVIGSESIITNAYTTAYGWPDNTPAGANTTVMGKSGTAGGSGTFSDPITMATGYSLAGGKETDDYAAGTKFYDPNLRKYFVIGDTCGDGNSPQTESCHVSEIKGTIQLDVWVGGQGANSSSVLACEDAVTRTGTLVENPPSNLAVVTGPVYNNGCATQYGDTIVTQ